MVLKDQFHFHLRHKRVHYQTLLLRLLFVESHHLNLHRVKEQKPGRGEKRAKDIVLNHLDVLQLLVSSLLEIRYLEWVYFLIEVVILK